MSATDIIPFDGNYKPGASRFGGRKGKSTGRLVGWQARAASSQEDFNAAMEMAQLLDQTSLETGALSTVMIVVVVVVDFFGRL